MLRVDHAVASRTGCQVQVIIHGSQPRNGSRLARRRDQGAMKRCPLTCTQASYRTSITAKRVDKAKPARVGLTEEQKQEIREAFDLFGEHAAP